MSLRSKFTPLFYLLLIFPLSFLYGQKLPLPYEYGKISQEEFTMKRYSEDTTASAVFLMNMGQMKVIATSFPKYKVTYYYRIKLFDKKAFDLADVELAFFGKKKVEKVSDLKAQITLSNGRQIALKKKDFIEEKLGEFINTVKFSFPSVQEGAILEYQYTLTSQDLFHPRDWYFQMDYPSKWSELRINLPKETDYACIPLGVSSLKDLAQRAPDGTLIYRLLKVPAIKEEPFVANLSDHYARLTFQLDRYNGQYLVSTWGTLARELLYYEGFGGQYRNIVNARNTLKLIKPLIANATTTKDTIEIIYKHLAKTLTWNGNYTRGMGQTVDELYEKRTGSSGALNLSLIALIRGVGLKANPVLISTRSNGAMNAQYPLVEQFNHVLARIEIDSTEHIIADVTDSLHPMDYPKIESLNYRGWMLTDYEPHWISVDFPTTTDVLKARLTLSEDGKVVGTLNTMSNGYSAISNRAALIDQPKEHLWEERFQTKQSDFQVTNIAYENVVEINKAFKTKMDLSSASMAMLSDDFIYFSPIVYTEFDENPFKSTDRQYNIDFPFPFREQYSLKLKIPENYTVDELPESVNIFLRDKGATFKYIITQKGQEVAISSSISIKQAQYVPDEYDALKDFFDQIASKFNEQIVLKRKR